MVLPSERNSSAVDVAVPRSRVRRRCSGRRAATAAWRSRRRCRARARTPATARTDVSMPERGQQAHAGQHHAPSRAAATSGSARSARPAGPTMSVPSAVDEHQRHEHEPGAGRRDAADLLHEQRDEEDAAPQQHAAGEVHADAHPHHPVADDPQRQHRLGRPLLAARGTTATSATPPTTSATSGADPHGSSRPPSVATSTRQASPLVSSGRAEPVDGVRDAPVRELQLRGDDDRSPPRRPAG